MDVDLTEDAIKAVVPAGQDSVINALRKLKNPKVISFMYLCLSAYMYQMYVYSVHYEM
jgi:hypothetical protein